MTSDIPAYEKGDEEKLSEKRKLYSSLIHTIKNIVSDNNDHCPIEVISYELKESGIIIGMKDLIWVIKLSETLRIFDDDKKICVSEKKCASFEMINESGKPLELGCNYILDRINGIRNKGDIYVTVKREGLKRVIPEESKQITLEESKQVTPEERPENKFTPEEIELAKSLIINGRIRNNVKSLSEFMISILLLRAPNHILVGDICELLSEYNIRPGDVTFVIKKQGANNNGQQLITYGERTNTMVMLQTI
jgi:hypothetical protein